MTHARIRPMLAATLEETDWDKIPFPVYASPKLNGIRCLCIDGKAMSRSGKLIPNKEIQKFFAEHAPTLDGMDGELVVGPPMATDVWNQTTSFVMSTDKTGEDWIFHIFDYWFGRTTFKTNLDALRMQRDFMCYNPHISFVPQFFVGTADSLEEMEQMWLSQGYEGLILRSPNSTYKNGRSTLREFGLVKVKRFSDSEADIIGFEELQHNHNDENTDELGYAKRSSAQEGKVNSGKLGAIVCQDIESKAIFKVGTGFTDAQRIDIWKSREYLLNDKRLVKYKYFKPGMTGNIPNLPVFLGFRDPIDMSK